MFENNGRTVIQMGCIVIKAVHPAVKRGIHRGIAMQVQINAQMNSPGLRHFIGLNFKLLRGVKQPGFAVAADADIDPGLLHLLQQVFGENSESRIVTFIFRQRTADAQIKYQLVFMAQVFVDNGSKAIPVTLQPVNYFAGLRHCRQSAGMS